MGLRLRIAKTPVRLHLTNVTGAGASQLLLSLLPALEKDLLVNVTHIDLPSRGKLSTFCSTKAMTVTQVYQRRLPNALSRVLECTFLAGFFDGDSPLLVLGDLPLRCRGPQTVFVQTAHLIQPPRFKFDLGSFKYVLARMVFRAGMNRVRAFIVQTDVMRDGLVRSYPGIAGRVHVVAQPVPEWLLRSGLQRQARAPSKAKGLTLIYPAADYLHKNHALLAQLDPLAAWPVERLTLTLVNNVNPAPHLSWVQCSGFLSAQAMIEAYSQVDALLFLSKEESYGFPLVEAMHVGLPIVCPDLPYAHTLCGSEAIYFDADCPASLQSALVLLSNKLDAGWWPNWSERMAKIPRNWEEVAREILKIATQGIK